MRTQQAGRILPRTFAASKISSRALHVMVSGTASNTAPNQAGRHAAPLPGAHTVTRSAVAARSKRGNLVGQHHPRARLTDHDVDLIRALHEGEDGLGYRVIARKFEVSVRTVRDICHYQRRATTPMRHTTERPHQAEPIAPAEAARQFGYRQEEILNELADACGLHRNSFAALVKKSDLLQKGDVRRKSKTVARNAQQRLKPKPARKRKPTRKPRR